MRRAALLLFLGLTIFLIDFLSKSYVHLSIPLMYASSPFYPYGGVAIFQDWHGIDFSLTHVMNKGAAWGMFAGLEKGLVALRILVIGSMLAYFLFFNKKTPQHIPLVCIISGAIGNVVDYFLYGHVVDMFYFVFWGYSYPVFNVADSAIFCGISLLIIQALLERYKVYRDRFHAYKHSSS